MYANLMHAMYANLMHALYTKSCFEQQESLSDVCPT